MFPMLWSTLKQNFLLQKSVMKSFFSFAIQNAVLSAVTESKNLFIHNYKKGCFFGAAFFVNRLFAGCFSLFCFFSSLDIVSYSEKKECRKKLRHSRKFFNPFFRTGGRLWRNCRNPVAERQERQRVLLRQERQAEQVAERELHLK